MCISIFILEVENLMMDLKEVGTKRFALQM